MAAKAPRRSASLPICRILLRRIFFFLFQRGEVEAGRPLAVPGRPHEELGGGSPESAAKTSLLPPFGGRWTAANDTSESAMSRP
jgi:hypothetical protein